MIRKLHQFVVVAILSSLLIASCEDLVEEGYDKDYSESLAELEVTPAAYNYGAIGDTLRYIIKAKSEFDIKSIVVISSELGASGSGYELTDSIDPFIDHRFGIIQKNVKQLDILYKFVIPETSSKVTLEFKLIDEEGQKVVEHSIIIVPEVSKYDSVVLYTQSSLNADGFSTIDGVPYRDVKQYEPFSSVNQAIKESLDMVFIVDESSYSAILAAPVDTSFQSGLDIKNKTRFKLINSITSEQFDSITNGSLVALTALDSISRKGGYNISGIQTGDIIGFVTDYYSANSFKTGLIRVNAIHPSSCEWYVGETYLIEMDVVTQITKDEE